MTLPPKASTAIDVYSKGLQGLGKSLINLSQVSPRWQQFAMICKSMTSISWTDFNPLFSWNGLSYNRCLLEHWLQIRIPYRCSEQEQGKWDHWLQWAQLHQWWTLARWKSVMLSDETRISVDWPAIGAQVWSWTGKWFRDDCVQEADCWGGGSNMAQTWVSYYSRTPLTNYHLMTELSMPSITSTIFLSLWQCSSHSCIVIHFSLICGPNQLD